MLFLLGLTIVDLKIFLLIYVGLTECFDIQNRLEKRVLSRLNCQFFYLLDASAHSICYLLSTYIQIQKLESSSSASSTGFIDSQDEHMKIIDNFNESVRNVLGHYVSIHADTINNPNNAINNNNNNNNANNNNNTTTNNNASNKKPINNNDDFECLKLGEAFPLIKACVNWNYTTM